MWVSSVGWLAVAVFPSATVTTEQDIVTFTDMTGALCFFISQVKRILNTEQ